MLIYRKTLLSQTKGASQYNEMILKYHFLINFTWFSHISPQHKFPKTWIYMLMSCVRNDTDTLSAIPARWNRTSRNFYGIEIIPNMPLQICPVFILYHINSCECHDNFTIGRRLIIYIWSYWKANVHIWRDPSCVANLINKYQSLSVI